MKKFVSYTIILLLSATLGLSKGAHVFSAIIVDGDVSAKDGSKNISLEANSRIYESFSIIIGNNSYLALIHVTGRTLELQTPGTYQAKDLSKMINEQLGDYTDEYKNFLFEDENKNSNYSKYAAIQRDLPQIINILVPKNMKIIPSKSFSIHWSSSIHNGQYKITIEDLMQEKIISEETSDTSFIIDLSKYPATSYYKVIISCNGYKSETSLRTYKHIAKLQKELDVAYATYDEQKALDCVIIAKYYERHHLLLHSQYYLEKAIKITDKDSYKKYYNTFLSNYNIK
ncbi:MAG: hypothetical protein GY828_06890 [Candidatus Gracilibacteria bacterium]|nr:hypothetical protein [Candidatus Gracilibacteria bacterium]